MQTLHVLNTRIIKCKKCPRLAKYIAGVAKVKARRYNDWEYWGKPLPGFGDPDAKLLIIGLAPAAHGGNRTGRMFTGDSSGDWLMRALFESGFANQPTSERRDDGLKLKSAYIAAIVRCAPPENKPSKEEIANCSCYLAEELKILKNVRVVLTLGAIAFNAYTSMQNRWSEVQTQRVLQTFRKNAGCILPSKQAKHADRKINLGCMDGCLQEDQEDN